MSLPARSLHGAAEAVALPALALGGALLLFAVTGLIGALVGAGIREEKAKFYADEVDRGKILITVIPHSEPEATRIESEWLDRGSEGVLR